MWPTTETDSVVQDKQGIGHIDVMQNGQIVRCSFFPNVAFADVSDLAFVEPWLQTCAYSALQPLLPASYNFQKGDFAGWEARNVLVTGSLLRDASFVHDADDDGIVNCTKGVRFLVDAVYAA